MNDEKTTVGETNPSSLEDIPLCLKDYFAERDDGEQTRNKSGPPGRTRARIAERWENLIILAFDEEKRRHPTRLTLRWYDVCVGGLMLACIAAIIAAFVK